MFYDQIQIVQTHDISLKSENIELIVPTQLYYNDVMGYYYIRPTK